VPLYTVLPFVGMLLAIALCPLLVTHWWERNRNKLLVSVLLGLPVLFFYLAREPMAVLHAAQEYVSFMILLASLYAIAGGIVLKGNLEATPLTNTAFLAIGSFLASLIGTTGASMLLIRPLLHTNRERARTRHTVIFFIFLVANVGGLLTPLGDPPLFLGYLRGVPFTWTFRLWLPWLATVTVLLLTYFVWDSIHHARESDRARKDDRARIRALSLRGTPNALGLVAVVLSVAFLGQPWRELAMAMAAGVSLWLTPRHLRRENRFTADPMVEVAVLFLGIFLTMIPALELLRLHGAALGVREPWQFFWVGGILSSLLDNAPTYLTFFTQAQGLGLPNEVAGMTHAVLTGLSLGTVFMGANTYIGNAPNFMVKAIAEEAKVRMPSFLGYALYAAAVLGPIYVVVTFLFLL
jgi:Na+/H+ antiporter NhaD/arsenite permease-like protein